jgi:ribosomal protein L37E
VVQKPGGKSGPVEKICAHSWEKRDGGWWYHERTYVEVCAHCGVPKANQMPETGGKEGRQTPPSRKA